MTCSVHGICLPPSPVFAKIQRNPDKYEGRPGGGQVGGEQPDQFTSRPGIFFPCYVYIYEVLAQFYGALVWSELGNMICSRHLFISRAAINPVIFLQCATHSKLLFV